MQKVANSHLITLISTRPSSVERNSLRKDVYKCHLADGETVIYWCSQIHRGRGELVWSLFLWTASLSQFISIWNVCSPGWVLQETDECMPQLLGIRWDKDAADGDDSNGYNLSTTRWAGTVCQGAIFFMPVTLTPVLCGSSYHPVLERRKPGWWVQELMCL